jgi:hypothetical protein
MVERLPVGPLGLLHALGVAVQNREVVQRHSDVGQVGVGVGLGELAPDGKRLPVGPLRLLHALGVAVQIRKVVQRCGDVGQVGVGVGLGELAPDGKRLPVGPLGLLHALGVAVQNREVVERHGAIGWFFVDAEQTLVDGASFAEMVELLGKPGVVEAVFGIPPAFPRLPVGLQGLRPFEAQFVDLAQRIKLSRVVNTSALRLLVLKAERGVEVSIGQGSGEFGIFRFRFCGFGGAGRELGPQSLKLFRLASDEGIFFAEGGLGDVACFNPRVETSGKHFEDGVELLAICDLPLALLGLFLANRRGVCLNLVHLLEKLGKGRQEFPLEDEVVLLPGGRVLVLDQQAVKEKVELGWYLLLQHPEEIVRQCLGL